MYDIDQDIEITELIRAAYAYRKVEQDGTPRLWRGKELQDFATSLDEAIEAVLLKYGEELVT
jgi:hypothetical protein